MNYTKNVYPHSFYQYKAQKRGYYDALSFVSASQWTANLSVEMKPFDGLDITPSYGTYANELAFARKILPNYQVLKAQTMLLAEAGYAYLAANGNGGFTFRTDGVLDGCQDSAEAKTFNVFAKDRTPVLTTATNLADGVYCGQCTLAQHTVRTVYKTHFTPQNASFSGSSVAQIGVSAGSLDADYLFAAQSDAHFSVNVVTRVTTSASLSGEQILFKLGSFSFGIKNGVFAFCYGTTWVNGNAATASTNYWFKVQQSGDIPFYSILYLVDDGTYTLDTLPADSQWQIGAQAQVASFAADENKLTISDGSVPWCGTIDLLNCRIQVRLNNSNDWQNVWHAVDVIG